MSEYDKGAGYSPTPRKRRGHRRVSSTEGFSGPEPRLGFAEPRADEELSERAERDRWLQEQRPPHHEMK